ncbi:MAG: Na/Pi cotransporter family protein [Campylobacterales bacterium]
MTDIIFLAISGLGIFLFGMSLLEEGLKKAAGNRFKRILRNSTSSIAKSITFGMTSTAILQSSSAVTLMALSFVGAKLITLASAIGIIYGSNIGTTVTGWIVAFLGFEVDIGGYSLLFLGIGGIIFTFYKKNPRLMALAQIIAGFGMVFLGLEYLKESASFVQESFDISNYLGYPLLVYVLIGFLLTAIIQSSSAAITIVLSALNSEIIGFEIAAAMIIGTNIGTTATAALGAIGGNSDKKRAALSHFIFNFITAFFAFVFIQFLIDLTGIIPTISETPTLRLVMFHTIFNVIGVLLLSPFITKLAELMQRFFAQKAITITEYIDKVNIDETDIAIVAYKKEVRNLLNKVMEFGLCQFNIDPRDVLVEHKKSYIVMASSHITTDCMKLYGNIKKLEIKILQYSSELSQKQLSKSESEAITNLLDSVKELSYATKMLKDSYPNLQNFEGDDGYLKESYLFYKQRSIKLYDYVSRYLDENRADDSPKVSKVLESLKNEYEDLMSKIPKAMKKYNLKDSDGASVLHVSRGFIEATESIIESIELFVKVGDRIEQIQKGKQKDSEKTDTLQAEEDGSK